MRKSWIVFAMLWDTAAAWAAPSGPLPSASPESTSSTEERGRAAYNAGVEALKRKSYAKAREQFQEATLYAPQLAEAWNNLGFTERKLGSYIAALAAYEQALRLKPGYPEALEYRGEAYLGLNRIYEAKQTYLELFESNRALSATFLKSMRVWVQQRRIQPAAGIDGAVLSQLQNWIDERAKIEAQNPPLTPASTASSW
jgi:tetratricopeptide (TPR) repeat protein